MFRLITDLPENVIGIEAVGHVSAADYHDVLEPAVAQGLKSHDKLRLLYVLGDEFEGYSAGGAWEDTKLGLAHWSAWERIAVVTDRTLIHDAVKAFAWMLPGAVRLFPGGDQDAATTWVSG